MEVSEARNFVLLLMVLLQNVHVFNCRSERVSAFKVPLKRNPLLIGGVLVAQGIHILVMQWPFMQKVLGVAPVGFASWSALLGIAALLLIVMEYFKGLQRKKAEKINC
jgi:magnesium-transporting ATPase (P-type)